MRALLAMYPLECHSRGVLSVRNILEDYGVDVVFMGNGTPKQIIDRAILERVDMVGISTYCGGELVLSEALMNEAEDRGIKNKVVFMIGGIFPPDDNIKLRSLGFHEVFLSATREEIIACIKKHIEEEELDKV